MKSNFFFNIFNYEKKKKASVNLHWTLIWNDRLRDGFTPLSAMHSYFLFEFRFKFSNFKIGFANRKKLKKNKDFDFNQFFIFYYYFRTIQLK